MFDKYLIELIASFAHSISDWYAVVTTNKVNWEHAKQNKERLTNQFVREVKWADGTLQARTHVNNNGIRHGLTKKWWSGGKLAEITNYYYGFKRGYSKSWNSDGKLNYNRFYFDHEDWVNIKN